MVAGRNSENKSRNDTLALANAKKTTFEVDVPTPKPLTPVVKKILSSSKLRTGSASRKRTKFHNDEEEIFVAIEPIRKSKRVRLTERQREKFIEQNENAIFFDEGFSTSNSLPLIARLPSEYLVDSQSQSGFASSTKSVGNETATDFCAFAIPDLPMRTANGSHKESSSLNSGKENASEVIKSSTNGSDESQLNKEACILSRPNSHRSDIWLEESDISDNELLAETSKNKRSKKRAKRKKFLYEIKKDEKSHNSETSGKTKRVRSGNDSSKENCVEVQPYLKSSKRNSFCYTISEEKEDFHNLENASLNSAPNPECESLMDRSPKKKQKTAKEEFLVTASKKTPRKGNVRSKDIRSFLSPKDVIPKQCVSSRGFRNKTGCCEASESIHSEKGILFAEENERKTAEEPQINESQCIAVDADVLPVKRRNISRKKYRRTVGKAVAVASNGEIAKLTDSIEIVEKVHCSEISADVTNRKDQLENCCCLADSIETEGSPAEEADMVIEEVIERIMVATEKNENGKSGSFLEKNNSNSFEELSGKEASIENNEAKPQDANLMLASNITTNPFSGAVRDTDGKKSEMFTPVKHIVNESIAQEERRTPGILKKGSPSSCAKGSSEGSSQKPKRVHFDACQDDYAEEGRSSKSNRQSMSPVVTGRRKLHHVALFHNPDEKTRRVDPPIIPFNESQHEERQRTLEKPLVAELVLSKDLLTPKMLTKLAPCGAQSLRTAFKSRGIKTVGDLAKLTESGLSALPIRGPKVESVRDVLFEHAKISPSSLKKHGEKLPWQLLRNEEIVVDDRRVLNSVDLPETKVVITSSKFEGEKELEKDRGTLNGYENEPLGDTKSLERICAIEQAVMLHTNQKYSKEQECSVLDSLKEVTVDESLSFEKLLVGFEKMEALEAQERIASLASIRNDQHEFSFSGIKRKHSAVTEKKKSELKKELPETISSSKCQDSEVSFVSKNDAETQTDFADFSLDPLFTGPVLDRMKNVCLMLKKYNEGTIASHYHKTEVRTTLCEVIQICTNHLMGLHN